MTLPAWVQKRDGTLVPFDPDHISSALFAAGESLGQPDAFLARELTDGVLHFLAAEPGDKPLTTEQIEESVTKAVRELGRPALAQAYADQLQRPTHPQPSEQATPSGHTLLHLSIAVPSDGSDIDLTEAVIRAYSLRYVFAPDVAATHRDGLLTLSGLESPFRLAGCVLKHSADLLEAISQARTQAGEFVAIDGPEYALLEKPNAWPSYVRELRLLLETAGLRGVVNLNSQLAPAWANGVAAGPLFGDPEYSSRSEALSELALELFNAMLPETFSAGHIVVQWHLSDVDSASARQDRLRKLIRRALEGAAISFVFDRPSRPVLLAPGVDRQTPAVLLTVALNLPELANQVGGHADAPEKFLHKVGSGVRLALSAGVQKRDFLRNQTGNKEDLASGFLLDRARLMVAPAGLHSVVATLLGCSLAQNTDGLDFARRVVQRIFDVVNEDGRSRHLPVGLDGSLLAASVDPASKLPAHLDLEDQTRVAAALHGAVDLQTAALYITDAARPPVDELVQSLQWLWRRSDVRHVQLTPFSRAPSQLPFCA